MTVDADDSGNYQIRPNDPQSLSNGLHIANNRNYAVVATGNTLARDFFVFDASQIPPTQPYRSTRRGIRYRVLRFGNSGNDVPSQAHAHERFPLFETECPCNLLRLHIRIRDVPVYKIPL